MIKLVLFGPGGYVPQRPRLGFPLWKREKNNNTKKVIQTISQHAPCLRLWDQFWARFPTPERLGGLHDKVWCLLACKTCVHSENVNTVYSVKKTLHCIANLGAASTLKS